MRGAAETPPQRFRLEAIISPTIKQTFLKQPAAILTGRYGYTGTPTEMNKLLFKKKFSVLWPRKLDFMPLWSYLL